MLCFGRTIQDTHYEPCSSVIHHAGSYKVRHPGWIFCHQHIECCLHTKRRGSRHLAAGEQLTRVGSRAASGRLDLLQLRLCFSLIQVLLLLQLVSFSHSPLPLAPPFCNPILTSWEEETQFIVGKSRCLSLRSEGSVSSAAGSYYRVTQKGDLLDPPICRDLPPDPLLAAVSDRSQGVSVRRLQDRTGWAHCLLWVLWRWQADGSAIINNSVHGKSCFNGRVTCTDLLLASGLYGFIVCDGES